MTQTAQYAAAYIANGFCIVRIPPRKKFPSHDGWNQPGGYFTDAQEAAEYFTRHANDNLGIVLGPSRVCSLDIDHTEHSRMLFSEFGVNIDELADSNPTVVGNPARFRVMFAVPEGLELSRHSINWPDEENPSKNHTVFEFRAGLVQDVLPPSIHPDTGQPYTWRTTPKQAGGLKPLPEQLLAMWLNWDVFKPQAEAVCPWAPKVEHKPAKPRERVPHSNDNGPSVIDTFNDQHSLTDLLARYGYRRCGKRWLSPHSKTKLPGVILLDDQRCYVHHASDPLCSDHPVDCFDLWTQYEHGGDYKRSTKAAAELLGLGHKPRDMRNLPSIGGPEPIVDMETGEILGELPPLDAYEMDAAIGPEGDEEIEHAPDVPARAAERAEPEPIRPLGWDRGVGYYLSVADGQMWALTATQHSKPYFMCMAPLYFWAERFTDETSKQRKIDWDIATEAMIRSAQKQGIFDPDRIRGRGAWWDSGSAVVHVGDGLIVNGVRHALDEVKTHFIYERALPIRINTDNPLPSSEAMKLYDICARLSFADPMGAKLLAGWVFLAPICGALQWRPHIWITGPSGSGKTTVIGKDGILGRALGSFKLFVQGDTSEAGIRQKIKQDGLPIMFDEFENDTEKAMRKVQDVMALVTQASSDSGAKILKGSASGKVEAFQIRSMFAFSSINISIRQHAARTRVTVLEMVQREQTPETREHYRQTTRMIVETLTPEYVDRLHARAVKLIDVVRQNAETFAEAASIVLNGRRFGDQIGTLLAGLYALHKDTLVSLEAAEKYIQEQDWADVKEVRESSDHDSCLKTIVTKQLRVESAVGVRTFSIGELVMICMGRSSNDDALTPAAIQRHEAADTLRRHGVIVHRLASGRYTVRIANDHPEMCKLLAGTVWADSYKKTLARLPGAKKLDPTKFGATTARGTELPEELFV